MLVISDVTVVRRDSEVDGWVAIDDGVIVQTGTGDPPGGERLVGAGGYLVPGFIDLDPHGGGGAWTIWGEAEDIRTALDFHLGHGTTRSLVGLTSAPIEQLIDGLRAVAQVRSDAAYGSRVMGAHLEGPFLAAARAGAQRREFLQDPDPALVRRLVASAPGILRMMTLAPELAGAAGVIEELTRSGVVAAIGHTDATIDEARAGFAAGATVTTHIFNGMPPLQSREPGPVGATLASSDVVATIVPDAVHVHDASVISAFRALGRERLALVTDATAVAGMLPGTYPDGDRRLEVAGGAARDADSGVLVGSILTMDAVLRRAVRHLGMTMVDAVHCVSTTPARLLGVDEAVGSIEPGKAADLVLLDRELNVQRVILGGRPLDQND